MLHKLLMYIYESLGYYSNRQLLQTYAVIGQHALLCNKINYNRVHYWARSLVSDPIGMDKPSTITMNRLAVCLQSCAKLIHTCTPALMA